jgi:transposase-like protein
MQPKQTYMKCRRGSDPATSGTSCPSLEADILPNQNPHSVSFKCKKCGYIWAVTTGGVVNF